MSTLIWLSVSGVVIGIIDTKFNLPVWAVIVLAGISVLVMRFYGV